LETVAGLQRTIPGRARLLLERPARASWPCPIRARILALTIAVAHARPASA